MTVGTVAKFNSSSRTPRQQLLLGHTNGRSRLDCVRLVSNPYPHGVKTYDHDSKQAVCITKAHGKAKVETTGNHAASVAQGSGNVAPPRSYRAIQRRHFDANAKAISLANMPETVPVKRGKFHRPACKPKELGLTNMALVDGEEKRYHRKSHDDAIKEEFVEMTSPMRRRYTFTPVQKQDNRSPEARLMPDGGRRKERGRTYSRVVSAQAATLPPWATE